MFQNLKLCLSFFTLGSRNYIFEIFTRSSTRLIFPSCTFQRKKYLKVHTDESKVENRLKSELDFKSISEDSSIYMYEFVSYLQRIYIMLITYWQGMFAKHFSIFVEIFSAFFLEIIDAKNNSLSHLIRGRKKLSPSVTWQF